VNGLHIENFGLPLNLMLAIPCRIVVGDLNAAVAELSNLTT
jgi:nucleoside 2-deoxyribosyltransferase